MSEQEPRQLGSQLQKRRRERGISIEQAAAKTKLKPELLRALERDDFAQLPHDIYSLATLRRYSDFLELGTNRLEREYLRRRGPLEGARPSRTRLHPRRSFVTSRWLALGALGLAAIAALGYLFLQLRVLAAPPRLDIHEPRDGQVVAAATVTVAGTTDPGATVLINSTPVIVGEGGAFSQELALQPGLNTILIEAASRTGRTSAIELSVVHTPPSPPVAHLAPPGSCCQERGSRLTPGASRATIGGD